MIQSNKVKTPLSWLWIVPTILVIAFSVLMVVPLVGMFFHMDAESIRMVFTEDSIFSVIWNSVLSSGLTTVISLVLAYCLAWCLERTAMRGKRVFRLLLTLPMLIPTVSIGMGAVLLGGNNGIITNLLGLDHGEVYGLFGVVYGSVMHFLPVAFLMMVNTLRFEDSSPYDAAHVLGISKIRQFFSITLPYLRKPLIATAFSVFTLCFTDYGVPLMVGGKFKTLPVLMYQEVIGQLDFGKGCVYGSILLVPAIVAFLLDLANKNQSNSAFVIRPFAITRQLWRDLTATVYTVIMSIFSLLPIVSFVVLAFVRKYPSDMTLTLDNFVKTFDMGAGTYLLNSVLMSVGVSVVGVMIGILTAYATARIPSKVSRALHLIAMATGAVPGVVLGLAYVLFFKGSPLYGTLMILVMVNTIHFFASPYLMMQTSFSKVNQNLGAVASTLGIGKLQLLLGILLPQCKRTVREMFSYFFVNSMMTISAVSFLFNTNNKPIALMINQFEAQAQMEAAAVVSLLILIVNVAVKVLVQGDETATENNRRKQAK